jgi:hypothetical protein
MEASHALPEGEELVFLQGQTSSFLVKDTPQPGLSMKYGPFPQYSSAGTQKRALIIT